MITSAIPSHHLTRPRDLLSMLRIDRTEIVDALLDS